MIKDEKSRRALTIGEAAKYCDMSRPVFCDWLKTGVIPTVPSRPRSSRVKIRIDRLDAFLDWLETEEAKREMF